MVVSENWCWLWTAYISEKGYGSVRVGDRIVAAHRRSLELFEGSIIPTEIDVHHVCKTKRCINPKHLIKVPHNNHPGGAQFLHKNKTHCKRGHEFTGENVYLRNRGGWYERVCKKCHNLATQRRRNSFGLIKGLTK